jgi:hypothetical protein
MEPCTNSIWDLILIIYRIVYGTIYGIKYGIVYMIGVVYRIKILLPHFQLNPYGYNLMLTLQNSL